MRFEHFLVVFENVLNEASKTEEDERKQKQRQVLGQRSKSNSQHSQRKPLQGSDDEPKTKWTFDEKTLGVRFILDVAEHAFDVQSMKMNVVRETTGARFPRRIMILQNKFQLWIFMRQLSHQRVLMSPIYRLGGISDDIAAVLMVRVLRDIDQIIFNEMKQNAIVTIQPAKFGRVMLGCGYYTTAEQMKDLMGDGVG